MNAQVLERRKEWSKVLRSGKYKQVKGKLAMTEGYCCLGVACKVSKLGNFVATREQGERAFFIDDKFKGGGFLCEEVMEQFGIHHNGRLKEGFEIHPSEKHGEKLYLTSLSDLNDYGCCTFLEIADFIDSGMLKDYEKNEYEKTNEPE